MTERFQGPHGDADQIKTFADRKADAAQTKATVPVETQSNGMLIGKTMDEEWRLATAMCQSGMLPASYNSPAKVFAARQFAFELGLKPLTGLRQIAVIHGNPSLFGDLPLALARASNQIESFREFFIDDKGNEISFLNKNLGAKVWAAVCSSKRKGMAEVDFRSYSLEDAIAAGLYNPSNKSGQTPWYKHTKRMLQLRARSWLLKDLYSDFLNGVAIAEYDFNALPEVDPVVNEVVNTRDLNELFSSPTPAIAEPIEPESEPTTILTPDEPIEGERFEAGFYQGELVSSVSKEDLAKYYKQLRAKMLSSNEAPQDWIIKIVKQIENIQETKSL